ncbi:Transposase IS66 family protein [Gemmata obscuriglobus]|nr:Transposase IS66 family protein [Gemmata obscuriglobus]VTS09224.1 Transposase IS66 family OS=Singulisphaera acidiphila (strain ATCC BAA-1392 / DSM 18658 / VKM B-2454 / MOB10) GN=Sinac_6249 PE=4 SV=1: DDE_Tnp_IS66 [Gemmata obscuriglobus UQM 2246]
MDVRRVLGVDPTNNAAEREVRHAVCWRKASFGTDSEQGSWFVERILTVIASCRRQERNVLAFLTDAVNAYWTGAKAPRSRHGLQWPLRPSGLGIGKARVDFAATVVWGES